MLSLLDLVNQPGFQLTSNLSSTKRSLQGSVIALTGVLYTSYSYLDTPALDLVSRFKTKKVSPKRFLASPTEIVWMAAVFIQVI